MTPVKTHQKTGRIYIYIHMYNHVYIIDVYTVVYAVFSLLTGSLDASSFVPGKAGTWPYFNNLLYTHTTKVDSRSPLVASVASPSVSTSLVVLSWRPVGWHLPATVAPGHLRCLKCFATRGLFGGDIRSWRGGMRGEELHTVGENANT